MQINAIPNHLDLSPMTSRVESGKGIDLPIPGSPDPAGGTPAADKSFGQFLKDAIGEVNDAQNNSQNMVARYAAGDKMDVHQVMLAAQEASTSLNMALQVRNKVVEAYQEVMRVSM